jgi:hypothetical protein
MGYFYDAQVVQKVIDKVNELGGINNISPSQAR